MTRNSPKRGIRLAWLLALPICHAAASHKAGRSILRSLFPITALKACRSMRKHRLRGAAAMGVLQPSRDVRPAGEAKQPAVRSSPSCGDLAWTKRAAQADLLIASRRNGMTGKPLFKPPRRQMHLGHYCSSSGGTVTTTTCGVSAPAGTCPESNWGGRPGTGKTYTRAELVKKGRWGLGSVLVTQQLSPSRREPGRGAMTLGVYKGEDVGQEDTC